MHIFFFDSLGTTPYYCALMSEGAPSSRLRRYANIRKLVHNKAELSGSIEAVSLPRFSQAVVCQGDIMASLSFSINDSGRWVVDIYLVTHIQYQCQRCLQLMAAERVEHKSTLGVVWSEEDERQLPVALDSWLIPEGEVEQADLFTCIEDELLLNLPVAAYHDYICVDESLLTGDVDSADSDDKSTNPFSVLASLKKQSD